MQTKFVKPVARKSVRDPVTKKPLPAEGASVRWSTFWSRRLKEGAITVETSPAAKKNASAVKNQNQTTGGK